MTAFTRFDENSAPAESKAELRAVRARYGFVPNLMAELAAAPAALEAYSSLSVIFAQSTLSAIEQQVVLLATSVENACAYGVAAHSTMAVNIGLDRDALLAIREGRAILGDPRLEILRGFTTKIVRQRGIADPTALEAFIQAGFTKANVLEVVTGVSLKTLSNYSNHLAQTPVDDAFQPMAWSKPALQAAD